MDELSLTSPGGDSNPDTLKIRYNGVEVSTDTETLNFIDPLAVSIGGTVANISINIIDVDDLANRLPADDMPDALFFAQDLGYWSYSDGITWTSLLIDLSNGIDGVLNIVNGGTGADNASDARDNLGLGTAATHPATDFQTHDTDLDDIAALDSSTAGAIASDGAGWIKKTYTQFKTALSLVKGDVGLGNVDNTSDVNKPVSTAQAAADAVVQAFAIQRANHTGTQLASTISDFDTQVRTSRLDQMTAPNTDLSINSHKLTSVLDPTNPQDAATMAWVLSQLGALDAKPEVAYISTAALPSNTYANGSSGVGATITSTANTPLIIDGVTTVLAAAGVGILVAGDTLKNGWYTLTQQGIAAVQPWILTRRTESDQAAEILSGYLTAVAAPTGLTGGTNNGKVFISLAPSPFVVGTDTVSFSKIGDTYTADGTTITLTGNQFSLTIPVAISSGGTGQTTQTAAFNALDPLTTKGDLITHDGTNSVRQGVGSDAQIPVADSSLTNGWGWKYVATPMQSKTTTYAILASDSGVVCNAGVAGFTVTLPTAVGVSGKRYTIKKSLADSSTNAVTIATTSSQTIDGSTTIDIITSGLCLEVQSDGANWRLI